MALRCCPDAAKAVAAPLACNDRLIEVQNRSAGRPNALAGDKTFPFARRCCCGVYAQQRRQRVVRTSERSKTGIRDGLRPVLGQHRHFLLFSSEAQVVGTNATDASRCDQHAAEEICIRTFLKTMDRGGSEHVSDALAKAMRRDRAGTIRAISDRLGCPENENRQLSKIFFDGCWVPGLDITSVEMAVVETSIVVQMCEKRFRYTCR